MSFPILGTPRPQFFDSAGEPLVSGTLSVLEPADDTNKASYPTADDADAQTNANSNPITLNSRGEVPGLFGRDGQKYKLVLKDSDAVTIWTADDVELPSELTAANIGSGLYPRTQAEIDASVTPTDYSYPPGEAPRYSTLADAISASKGPIYKIKLDGSTRSITSTVTIDEPVVIEGVGTNTGVTAGSIIENTTNDVIALDINSTGNVQRVAMRDFGILHEAATKPAIRFYDGAAYGQIDNIVINCNDVGYGGVLFGDELASTVGEAWQGVVNNLRVDDYTDYGIRVNTTGHTLEFRNCSPRSDVDGAHGIYINSRNVHIYGGQYGAPNTGGIPIYFHNIDSQAHHRGSVNDVVFEGVDAGEYAIVIDGATHAFTRIEIHRVGTHLGNNLGTMVKFGRATNCVFSLPNVVAPTGGGILCEWGEFSDSCTLVCKLAEGATSPITVHASATKALKRVTGVIPRASVANITTDANLTTILPDGVDELPPGFVPVHRNGAWNYWLVTLADDAASSFTLPAVSAALVRSRVQVLNDGAAAFMGEAIVDADSGGAAITEIVIGADFEVATGALAGTTGTDAKVTLSAHTDGKIYLENRSGAARDFTVLLTPVIFGT